jgi:hypothetical protein
MVIAQSLGEYGGGASRALASAMDAGLRAFSTVVDTVRSAEPTTWLVLAVAAFIVWFAFKR